MIPTLICVSHAAPDLTNSNSDVHIMSSFMQFVPTSHRGLYDGLSWVNDVMKMCT